MGRSYPVSSNTRNTYVLTNGISWRYFKHSLRAVGQLIHYQVNTHWPQYPAGSFRFRAGLTSLPGIVNTGHPFASFLVGGGSGGALQVQIIRTETNEVIFAASGRSSEAMRPAVADLSEFMGKEIYIRITDLALVWIPVT